MNKDLLRKEHYCHKVHALVMKNIAYPLLWTVSTKIPPLNFT